MTQQIVNIGYAPGDGTGDPLRVSFTKINNNFTEVYGNIANLTAQSSNTLQNEITGISATLSTELFNVTTNFITLQTNVNSVISNINATVHTFDSNITILQSNISTITNHISNIESNVTLLQNTGIQTTTDITAINSNIANLSANINSVHSELQSNVSTINTTITNLTTGISSFSNLNVSNNSIYLNNKSLTIDNLGNLIVDGFPVYEEKDFGNIRFSNQTISSTTGNLTLQSNVQISSIIDHFGTSGLSGQVLSSTGSGIEWMNLSGGLAQISATQFVAGQGTFGLAGYTFANASGDTGIYSTADGFLQFINHANPSAYVDAFGTWHFITAPIFNTGIIDNYQLGTTGTTGQLLSSTGNGLRWVSPAPTTIVYDRLGTVSDNAIYTGSVGITGNTAYIITLPRTYSNANYKVQLTYSGINFNPSNVGTLYVTVIDNAQFSIQSTNNLDTNNVNWTTFGSNAS